MRRSRHTTTNDGHTTYIHASVTPPAPVAPSASPISRKSHHRRECQLYEETRQQTVEECLSYDDHPFLYSCASGDMSEVRRMLSEEILEQQRIELQRIHKQSKAKATGTKYDHTTEEEWYEETYLQQQDSMGYTGMHWACAFGHVEIMQLLYDTYVESLPEKTNPTIDSEVVLRESLMPEFLSPMYLFINRTTLALDTPLHIAAYNVRIDAMQWLLEHGADLTARNTEGLSNQLGQTPLMCIVEKKIRPETQSRQTEACTWMLKEIHKREQQQWIDIDNPANITIDQLQRANAEQMIRNHPHRLPVYRTNQTTMELETSSLKDAAPIPSTAAKPPVSPYSSDVKDEDGTMADIKPPLKSEDEPMQCDTESSMDLLTGSTTPTMIPGDLFPLLSSINDRRDSGSTALMIASFAGNYSVVLQLLNHGALVDLDLYDGCGRPVHDSALLNSIEEGHFNVTRLLLEWGADRFVKNIHGETPVTFICSADQDPFRKNESLRINFLELLFYEGVDSSSVDAVREFYLNERDNFGASAFVWAVRRGCLSVLRFLVNLGCRVDDVDPTHGNIAIRQVAKRIEKSRTMKKNLYKNTEHVRLCAILNFLCTHQRTAPFTEEISDELKVYISDTVRTADEMAEAIEVANRAAAAEANRKRNRAATIASHGSTAPSTSTNSTKPPLKKAKMDSSPSKPIDSAAVVPSRSKRDRSSSSVKPPLPVRPIASSAPTRFFKGGRQHQHVRRNLTDAPKSMSMIDTNSEGEDTEHSTDGEQEEESNIDDVGIEAPPPPSTHQSRTISAKLQKPATTIPIVPVVAPSEAPPSVDVPLLHGASLNGELSHESQVDDMMLDTVDHTAPTDEGLQPLQPPHTLQSDGMEEDDTGAINFHVAMAHSPTKFAAAHSNSHGSLYSSMAKSSIRDLHHDSHLLQSQISMAPFRHSDGEFPSTSMMIDSVSTSAMRINTHHTLDTSSIGITLTPSATSSDAPTTMSMSSFDLSEVRVSLSNLGLSEFLPTFISNRMGVDQWKSLVDGTNDDVLKELITPLGPRLIFRNAMRQKYSIATTVNANQP